MKLVLLWRKLSCMELGKDVVLVPYYLGKFMGCPVVIVTGYDDDTSTAVQAFEEKHSTVTFDRRNLSYTPTQRIPIYIKYLFEHAKNIDLLMCFHWKLETFVNIFLYKLLNRKGRVYVKLDSDGGREWNLSHRSFISRLLRKRLYYFLLQRVSCLSCETSATYNSLISNSFYGNIFRDKLMFLPNSFDEELFASLQIKKKTFKEKENIFITVARLGTHQKNTEMLLDAIKKTTMKDWKCVLIGPYDDALRQQYACEHLHFTGAIIDKQELWEWYNRAKVFVCTSRWESYGIVLDEAKFFSNYIVTTDVGAAQDVINHNQYGCIIPQEDASALARELQCIIDGKTNIQVYENYDAHELSYANRIKTLVDALG